MQWLASSGQCPVASDQWISSVLIIHSLAGQ